MSFFLAFSFVVMLLYFHLINGFRKSFSEQPEYIPRENKYKHLSVVVPFNDGGRRLYSLIAALGKQTASLTDFEVILVNDYSQSIVPELNDSGRLPDNFKLISNKYPQGKKFAMKTGVEAAFHDYVLFTDADCLVGQDWVRLFANFFFNHPDAVILSSGVQIQNGSGLTEIYQAIDFASLVATSAAGFFQGSPVLCNAANMGVRKDFFLEAFPFIYPEIKTGDDIFLMLHAKKHYPGKLFFIKNKRAFVQTRPLKTWNGLFRQRLRWSSKSTLYRDGRLLYVSIIVLIINLLILACGLGSFLSGYCFFLFIISVMLKSLIDFGFLRSFLRFSGQEILLRYFFVSQLINVIWNFVLGIAGILYPVKKVRG